MSQKFLEDLWRHGSHVGLRSFDLANVRLRNGYLDDGSNAQTGKKYYYCGVDKNKPGNKLEFKWIKPVYHATTTES